MFQFIKGNKILILGGICVIAAAFYYFNFLKGGEEAPVVTSAADSANSPVTQDLLITLTSLKIIALDDKIFKDPVFISLSDFGVQIPPETVGRRNPFAPIGSQ